MARLEDCPTCDNPTSENAVTCPSCGEPLGIGWVDIIQQKRDREEERISKLEIENRRVADEELARETETI